MLRKTTDIGKRIREERKKLNMTQEQLAEKVGVGYKFIGQIERSERNASLEKLFKIAECLSVPIHNLLNEYRTKRKNIKLDYLLSLVHNCTDDELDLIIDVIKSILAHVKKKHGIHNSALKK